MLSSGKDALRCSSVYTVRTLFCSGCNCCICLSNDRFHNENRFIFIIPTCLVSYIRIIKAVYIPVKRFFRFLPDFWTIGKKEEQRTIVRCSLQRIPCFAGYCKHERNWTATPCPFLICPHTGYWVRVVCSCLP